MRRYLIEDIQLSETGKSFDRSKIIAIKYFDGRKSRWLTNVDYDGSPSFYLSKESISYLIADKEFESGDDSEINLMHSIDCYHIRQLDEFFLGDYYEIEEFLQEDSQNAIVPLIRLLLVLSRFDIDDFQELIDESLGHYADEIDLSRFY